METAKSTMHQLEKQLEKQQKHQILAEKGRKSSGTRIPRNDQEKV
jgi:hypothetical protein